MKSLPNVTAKEVAPILRRDLKTKIVFVLPDNRILSHKFRPGDGNNAATYALWHKCCDKAFPKARVLNEMPFDDAATLYAAALRQPVKYQH